MPIIRIGDQDVDVPELAVTHITALEDRIKSIQKQGKTDFTDRVRLLKINDSLDLNLPIYELKKKVVTDKGYKVEDGIEEAELNGILRAIEKAPVKKVVMDGFETPTSEPKNDWNSLKDLMENS
jgi:hypothetical protein